MPVRLLIFLFGLHACGIKVAQKGCIHQATVRSYQHLDGCSFLFVLSDSVKMSAINTADFVLEDGLKVRIDYTIVEDAISICMAEDQIIRINCLETLGQVPVKKTCLNIDSLEDAGWLRDTCDSYQIETVSKYDYLDGKAYLLKKGAQYRLYDCQANLLCAFQSDKQDECDRMNLLENQIEIFVAHR